MKRSSPLVVPMNKKYQGTSWKNFVGGRLVNSYTWTKRERKVARGVSNDKIFCNMILKRNSSLLHHPLKSKHAEISISGPNEYTDESRRTGGRTKLNFSWPKKNRITRWNVFSDFIAELKSTSEKRKRARRWKRNGKKSNKKNRVDYPTSKETLIAFSFLYSVG